MTKKEITEALDRALEMAARDLSREVELGDEEDLALYRMESQADMVAALLGCSVEDVFAWARSKRGG